MENSIEVPQKIKNKIGSSDATPRHTAPGYDRATCTPMFIAALFTIAKLWKQPRCHRIDEWIKKMWQKKYKQYYEKQVLLREGHYWEREGKRRKLK
jgi:hypothetical protein